MIINFVIADSKTFAAFNAFSANNEINLSEDKYCLNRKNFKHL